MNQALRLTALLCICSSAAFAQVRDTARARGDTLRAPSPARIDTAGPFDTVAARPELQPPLSPRRAFLYSLLVPGYAQSILGRPRAGALQVAFEAAALTMIRISAADVREARRNLADSVVVSYVDEAGNPRIRYERTQYTRALLRARQTHLEDWIAVLFANHLFSAADAYVAALLWDLPAEISVTQAGERRVYGLRLWW